MFDQMKATARAARRMGETSFVMNKLAVQWFRQRGKSDTKFAYLLRDAMQELGSTYIKLGQLIASSPTIFPDDYIDAFQTCLDQTPSLPYDEILPILESQLGVKLKTRFSYISKTPLASASIAQVHAATLITGEDVVIKIQKPNVKNILETDFHFLQFSTQVMEMINPKAWKTSIKDIVEEIRNGMMEECDFRKELKNIEEFAQFLHSSGITQVVVPKVYKELSSEKVLVMERFYGVSLSDIEGVRKICPEPEQALVQALDTWFMSLRQCQIYHADLHAGNVMMLNDGRIGFIDFGIVGRLSNQTWEGITSLAVCVPAQDFDGLALALSKIGATKDQTQLDLKQFSKDLKNLWETISGDQMLNAQDPDSFWRAITMDFSSISARHGIRFPREFTLLIKQFLYFDRYIRLLAPSVDLFDVERMDLMGVEYF